METYQKIIAFLSTNSVEVILGFVLLAIEYFLGKTDLVKAGSTVELVLNTLKKIIEKLKALKKV